MTQERGAGLVQAQPSRPVGLRMETLRGELTPTAGAPITTVARRLALWWPGGAWVYAWPVAIEFAEGNGRPRTRRIGNVHALTSGLLATLGATACVVYLARRARMNDR